MTPRWAALAIVTAGCPSPTAVTADQVLTLTAPPSAVADGDSPIVVSVCVPGSKPRASGLTATLTLSRSQWETPTSPSSPLVYTAPLGGVACVQAQAVAPSDLAPLLITASVAGFSASACVQMTPPTLAFVELSASPPVLAVDGTNTVTVTALPVVSAGTVPPSTEVTFSATLDPPDAGYALFPVETTLTEAGAVTTLAVPYFVDSVTVTAKAQVPAAPACPGGAAGVAGASLTASATIPLLPVPEGGATQAATGDAATE